MKNLLLKLLNLKTTEDNKDELIKAIDILDMYFSNYDVRTRRYESKGKHSLVVTTKFTKSPKIMLAGHIDVVSALESAFEPKEIGNKVYGRGTSDMKGMVVAMIFALTELLDEKRDLDIGLMVTSDEEIGGFNGAGFLLNEEGFSAEVAFIPDSTNGDWNVCTDEKGLTFVEFFATGKSAHGSRPWEGINAVDKCWKTYRDIRDEFRERYGKLSEEDNWKPTINLSSINGGETYNKVPNEASMRLDIRYPYEYPADEIQDIIKRAAENNGIQYEVKFIADNSHTDSDNPYVQLYTKVVKDLTGHECTFYKAHGGSDSRFFSKKGIPVVASKPNASSIHIEDEWVDFDDLVKFKDVIKEWILRIHQ